MDLSPFFRDVSRIAVALEEIARNTAPVFFEQRLEAFEAADLLKSVQMPTEALPPPITVSPSEETVAPEVDQILKAMKAAYEGGKTTANGLARVLIGQGIPHPEGHKWTNRSVLPFMNTLGLTSTYVSRGGRGRRKTDAPEIVVEAKPEPARKTIVIEKPAAPVEEEAAHMNLRELLTPPTHARLKAWESARAEGRTISDAEMIAAAVAAGMVRKMPDYVDSTGFNHRAGQDKGTVRARGAGADLGDHSPSQSGSMVAGRKSGL